MRSYKRQPHTFVYNYQPVYALSTCVSILFISRYNVAIVHFLCHKIEVIWGQWLTEERDQKRNNHSKLSTYVTITQNSEIQTRRGLEEEACIRAQGNNRVCMP